MNQLVLIKKVERLEREMAEMKRWREDVQQRAAAAVIAHREPEPRAVEATMPAAPPRRRG